jgi:hypothetical protein
MYSASQAASFHAVIPKWEKVYFVNERNNIIILFKDKAQTAVFKDPVRTAL